MSNICSLVHCLLVCANLESLYDIRYDLDVCVELQASVREGVMGSLLWDSVPERVSTIKVSVHF